jgi:hypothetical protein
MEWDGPQEVGAIVVTCNDHNSHTYGIPHRPRHPVATSQRRCERVAPTGSMVATLYVALDHGLTTADIETPRSRVCWRPAEHRSKVGSKCIRADSPLGFRFGSGFHAPQRFLGTILPLEFYRNPPLLDVPGVQRCSNDEGDC